MNRKIGMIKAVLICIAAVGTYLTVVGMCILYLGHPMDLGRMMNRDGLLFLLLGTLAITWANLQYVNVSLRRRCEESERMTESLMSRLDDMQGSVLRIHKNQISLTHRVFILEKNPDNETETGIETN